MKNIKGTKKPKLYIIGVDGGGTKTLAVIADPKGKILFQAKSGSSSPRNVGIEKSVFSITAAIIPLLKKIKRSKIISTVIALPSIEEEYYDKKGEIFNSLKNQKRISKIFQGDVKILSDQIAAFRSGTNEKDGVLLIAGTGCVAYGWRGNQDFKTSGWGWLTDEGSAFWVGQMVLQAILKDIDGRGAKTRLTDLTLREFKTKDKIELLKTIYSQNPTEVIPRLSIICDKASKNGDKVAKKIMAEAGKELALAAKIVIQGLKFQKIKFPLVLIGSIFKSKIVLDKVKKYIKKAASKAQFILPREKPVKGAIRLAMDGLKWR